ncbi:Fes1-domain-containing protein [Trichocladium antarcticum]|uniref:Fes1-domain-containing protein n=1 Tax=Trichocladium antarcticum TaxID=1450529 RepID=A0AAN6UTP6_9PEZI|nr:Fes1-domain-containing protein [Trichocladium antarcticum]
MDKNLNSLLKWSIEHTAPSTGATGPTGVTTHPSDNAAQSTTTAAPSGSNPPPGLDREVLAALMGGPSDADLMRAAIEVIQDPATTLDNKLIAFDNFEQLIESLDNANNLAPLALWAPLIALLAHPSEAELRRYAAWCVGTAVQNNVKSQTQLLAHGGVVPLVGLAVDAGEDKSVRRKAVYALSSAVRNYQPALDAALEELSKKGADGHGKGGKVDAEDMDAVDGVIGWLRERVNGEKA